ncbi:M23 family metallopeptidase [Candidatus Beckwithbacteria bacterium]|nr:M23 family metallopeptidase [Candidatus Beckwithbacteria bacterium]
MATTGFAFATHTDTSSFNLFRNTNNFLNNSLSGRLVNYGMGKVGEWALGAAASTGLKKTFGKLAVGGLTKLAGALGVNIIPVVGQAVSAVMLAKQIVDIAEQLPVVGKAVGFGKRFWWVLPATLLAGLIALIAKLLNLILSIAGTVGPPMLILGLATANPLLIIPGLALTVIGHWPTISKFFSNLFQGANNLGTKVLNLFGAGASEAASGGMFPAFVHAPLIAVGAVGITTTFLYINLISAFRLPPFDTLQDVYNKIDNLTQFEPGMPECWPVSGYVTQGMNTGDSHTGVVLNSIDIGGNDGADVHATHNGVVVEAGWNSTGYGKLVRIEGTTGGLPFTTYYAHLETITVNEGATVKKGQVIGTVDSTGNSEGPHLHYELRGLGSIADTILLSGCIDEASADRIENGKCIGQASCNFTISQIVQPE